MSASRVAFRTGFIEIEATETFEDITEASGVGVIENTAMRAFFVDVDNDGRQGFNRRADNRPHVVYE